MRRSTPYGGPPRRVYNKFLIVYQVSTSLSRVFESFLRFCEDLRRRSVVSRPAPEVTLHFFIINVNFLLTIIFKVCIIYLYSKGDKSNMENAIVYILAGIFMYALFATIVPLLWAESPILFICAVVGGLTLPWANGDWY